jgi:hypothetical protein
MCRGAGIADASRVSSLEKRIRLERIPIWTGMIAMLWAVVSTTWTTGVSELQI